jgi:ribonuclease Z
MLITFLGTGAGVPTSIRNVSSIAVRLPQRAETWLFDCGEGTQHQMLRTAVRPSQITRIHISHMHGDHIFGLPGLLATCSLAGDTHGIDLYGPPELESYLNTSLDLSATRLGFPLNIHVAEPGTLYRHGEFTVDCRQLDHRPPSLGFRIIEDDRPGRFDVDQARALGIEPGPVYKQLKRGEVVTLEDGRQIDGAALCGPPQPGRRIALCFDTARSPSAVELAEGADLLIHEGTFASEHAELAAKTNHSTVTTAAQVAAEAGVQRLIITHISSRYARGNPITPHDLLNEARAVFANTELAHDLMEVEV